MRSLIDQENVALLQACRNGHAEITRILLQDPRVDPSTQDNMCLVAAAANGFLECVEAVLAASSPYEERFRASRIGMQKALDFAAMFGRAHGSSRRYV